MDVQMTDIYLGIDALDVLAKHYLRLQSSSLSRPILMYNNSNQMDGNYLVGLLPELPAAKYVLHFNS